MFVKNILTGFFLSVTPVVPAFTQEKPNIIFILADDLGWTDLSCTGSDFYETPHIDTLRKRGMLFTHAYTNAANSAPSRASIMTGMYTPRHGIYTVDPADRGKTEKRKLISMPNQNVLADTLITFPKILQENGYNTIHIGKWHLGSDSSGNGPLHHGFDINIAGDKNGHPFTYFYPFCSKNKQCLTNLELNDSTNKYLTDRLTNEAVLHIKAAGKQPFFLYLSHYAVHTPIQAKNEIVEKYIRKKKGKRHNNPEYAAMIESLDNSVAKILQTLEEENKLNSTIIVFMSDNGGMLNGISDNYPLRGGKGTPYEGGNRVPLIISFGDKIKANSTNHIHVMGADLFPTLLDFAGIPVTHTIDGISLKGELSGKHNPKQERDLFFFFPAYLESYGNPDSFRATPYSSIISGDWKLIRFFEDAHTELYNLKKDTGESNDLSKKYPSMVKDLLIKLKSWEQKVDAPVNFELNPLYKPEINK